MSIDKETTIQELREYLLDKGFRYKGVWYFRISWMTPRLLSFIKNEKGLARRLGTISDAVKKGIKLPGDGKYDVHVAGHSLIYWVNNNRINRAVN